MEKLNILKVLTEELTTFCTSVTTNNTTNSNVDTSSFVKGAIVATLFVESDTTSYWCRARIEDINKNSSNGPIAKVVFIDYGNR